MRLLISGMILVGLLMSAGGVHAANLLTNPDFNNDLSGWGGFGGWDSSDRWGIPGSGSVLITVSGIGSEQYVNQCINVSPGETITLGAAVYSFVPQPQPSGAVNPQGQAAIRGFFRSGPDCTGTFFSSPFIHLDGQPNSFGWEDLTVSGVVPTGAQSVEFRIMCTSHSNAPAILKCRGDKAEVLPEPSRSLLALIALGTISGLKSLR